MTVWVPIVMAIGFLIGWALAYPLAKSTGYHDGYVDASRETMDEIRLGLTPRERERV